MRDHETNQAYKLTGIGMEFKRMVAKTFTQCSGINQNINSNKNKEERMLDRSSFINSKKRD